MEYLEIISVLFYRGEFLDLGATINRMNLFIELNNYKSYESFNQSIKTHLINIGNFGFLFLMILNVAKIVEELGKFCTK
jgi:hypothetical protein